MRVVVVARDNVLVVPCDELEVVNVVYAERKGVKRAIHKCRTEMSRPRPEAWETLNRACQPGDRVNNTRLPNSFVSMVNLPPFTYRSSSITTSKSPSMSHVFCLTFHCLHSKLRTQLRHALAVRPMFIFEPQHMAPT